MCSRCPNSRKCPQDLSFSMATRKGRLLITYATHKEIFAALKIIISRLIIAISPPSSHFVTVDTYRRGGAKVGRTTYLNFISLFSLCCR